MMTKLRILPQSVELWQVHLPNFINSHKQLSNSLSKDEIDKALRFKTQKLQIRYLAVRHLVRKILSLYLDVIPSEICFKVNNKGKPYLQNQALHFNISHSGDYFILAVNLKESIGIDIEEIKSPVNLNIAKRFFGHSIHQYLLSMPEPESEFYKFWVANEAIIKLYGLGIYDNLSIALPIPLKAQQLLTLSGTEKVWLSTMTFSDIYQIAIATGYEPKKILFRDWQTYFQVP